MNSAVVLAVLGLLAFSGCREPAPMESEARAYSVEAERGETIHADHPCGPSGGFEERYKHFLYWTPDAAHLVFDVDDTIWTLNIEHTRLREVADVSLDYHPAKSSRSSAPKYGFYADVSPDGFRIVYSTCEYGLDDPPSKYYEVAVVNVDGTGRRRLTEGERFEGYPAWSPDGTQIVFTTNTSTLSRSTKHYQDFRGAIKLATISADPLSGDSKAAARVHHFTGNIALYPLVWSPDGQRLAYIANEGDAPFRLALYTTELGGVVPARISALSRSTEMAPAPPSWSPDGEELAFALVEGEEAVLYAAKPDGSAKREVWRSGADGPSAPIVQVAWSPDGSELLFVSDGVYVVGADGIGLRSLPVRRYSEEGIIRAAWSPDGPRVAVYYPEGRVLLTVSREGKDLRPLAGRDGKGSLHALAPSQPERSVDLVACSEGLAVPDPEENPGLVHDCEVLLSIRDQLAGDSELLNWDVSIPIGEWEGVMLGSSPPRVHVLHMPRSMLTGTLPPELARLSELRTLDLSGNYLSGGISSELGQLSELTTLLMTGSYLSGSIPPELGSLPNLEELDLGWNYLSGNIPAELGSLVSLEELNLGGNFLSGSIPPELGGLPLLRNLDLRINHLGGSIPPELGGLVDIETLNVAGNQFSGCVPVELSELWVEASGLERCAE